MQVIDVGRPILRLCLRACGGEPSLYVSVRNDKEEGLWEEECVISFGIIEC